MDIVKNFINISGLANEVDFLAHPLLGQTIQYSENDIIFIPTLYPEAGSIFKILIEVDLKSCRTINLPINTIVTLEGVKKFKIIYADNNSAGKASFINIDLPFNTFFQFEPYTFKNFEIGIENFRVFILDASFNILEGRKIASYLLYMINANIKKDTSKNQEKVVESKGFLGGIKKLGTNDIFIETNKENINVFYNIEEEYL